MLATGSAPWLPPVNGLERAHVFRSIADMRAIRAAASSARTAVVVGGGLLGLEAARGLRELGVDVTVVHLADRLMELQLDPLAARLLERRIRALGIDVLCERRTEAVHRRRRRAGRRRACCPPTSSSSRPASAPRSRSRATPAWRSGAACWSTTTCARARPASGRSASAPSTAARSTGCGRRCSSRRARRARRSPAGPAAFLGAVPATTLKVAGIDLFCAGHAAETDPMADEVIALDSRRERYRKLVVATAG